jgi:spheroidene monooxygenase
MIAKVLKDHNSFPGLLFSRGFSEIPLREQATFSVWENVEHMKKFAYSSFHAMAIKITRRKKGFREDMYTRFQPVATMGTWHGDNPLINKVQQLSDYQLAPVALK